VVIDKTAERRILIEAKLEVSLGGRIDLIFTLALQRKQQLLAASTGCVNADTIEGHVGVMQIAIDRAKWRTKTDEGRRIRLVPFCHNLLIPLDLSRPRQLLINLVSRLLTEGRGTRTGPDGTSAR
jgi:hypothetical protein